MSEQGVAIVGMSLRAPDAASLEDYWRNIREARVSISTAPPDRIPEEFFRPVVPPDEHHLEPSPIPTRQGGFIDTSLNIDPVRLGISPLQAASIEPDQLLALCVATEAITDAGMTPGEFDGSRTGVILGRGGYLTPATTRFSNRVRLTRQVAEILHNTLPDLGPETTDSVLTAVIKAASNGPATDVIGFVSNLCASRIANRLDLGGPAYTIDSACASSLLAIDQSIDELRRHRCDLVIAGGVHHCQEPVFWSVFTELHALSPSGNLRPFDRRADGTLVGEATGMVVLKRLEDAERDGNRIYAVITGSGVSSDGRATSLVNPNSSAQIKAVTAAWAEAGVDPTTDGSIGFLEGHGTGTTVGDAAELRTIAAVFGPASKGAMRPKLGSVKGMIGHTMHAAGVMSIIKAALCLYQRVIPPTPNCETPHDLLGATRFETSPEATPWEIDRDGLRRAGVNAFGFGGINAHIVLEEFDRARPSQPDRRQPLASSAMIRGIGASLAEALRGEDLASPSASGGYRSVRRPGSRVAQRLIEHLACTEQDFVMTDDLVGSSLAAGAQRPLIAFIFPGLEAVEVAPGMDLQKSLQQLVSGQFRLNQALQRAGVTPDVVGGASMGEMTALACAGAFPEHTVLGGLDHVPWPTVEAAPGLSAVLSASADVIREFTVGSDITVTHDNSPTQCIVAGDEGTIRSFLASMLKRGIAGKPIPLSPFFHTSAAAPLIEEFRSTTPASYITDPTIETWSGSTAAVYPSGSANIRDLMVTQLATPARLRQMTLGLYDRGVRAYICLGRSETHRLITQTLHDKPHVSISLDAANEPGSYDFAWLDAVLWTIGRGINLPAATQTQSRIPLRLGVQLVDFEHHETGTSGKTEDAGTVAVAKAPAVNSAVAQQVSPACETRGQHMVDISLQAMPYLRDHSFFRQRPGWPDDDDRCPVVPGTTILDIFQREAERIDRHPVTEVEDLRFAETLIASPPQHVPLLTSRMASGMYEMSLGTFASARATTGAYPSQVLGLPRIDRTGEGSAAFTASDLYESRRLFHGPAFRGIAAIDGIGPRHIRGTLRALPTPGALLDAAGQLLGCWLNAIPTSHMRVWPVSVCRVRFFRPLPMANEKVECDVGVRKMDHLHAEADFLLRLDGQPIATVEGWTVRHFADRPRAQAADIWPEYRAISRLTHDGWVFAREEWSDLVSRDVVMRNHLGSQERAEYERQTPRSRRQWLLGRIAIKDAVRNLLWSEGESEVFPAEIQVANAPSGAPLVTGRYGRSLDGVKVSVAHTGHVAVAIARRNVRGVGIDIETVSPLDVNAVALAFTPREQALLDGWSRTGQIARQTLEIAYWAAKEATGKAHGTGVTNPHAFDVSPAGDVHHLIVQTQSGQETVTWGTMKEPDTDQQFVVAWTEI